MPDGSDRRRSLTIGERTVRFDTPRPPEVPERTEQSPLLRLFRSLVKKSPQNRRRMPRHEAASFQLWVGWWSRRREFRALPARLSNISRGGALVFLANPPRAGEPVWICLGETASDDCVEAAVLAVRKARRGECAVRLAFREPCPHRFFEAAVCYVATRPRHRKEGTAEPDEPLLSD